MATKLTNLQITRVALVDRGANFDKASGDGAHILLYKRDATPGPIEAVVAPHAGEFCVMAGPTVLAKSATQAGALAQLSTLAQVLKTLPIPTGGVPGFKYKAEALGTLIRAGFDPEVSCRVVGLPTIPHLGLPPITVKSPEDVGDGDLGLAPLGKMQPSAAQTHVNQPMGEHDKDKNKDKKKKPADMQDMMDKLQTGLGAAVKTALAPILKAMGYSDDDLEVRSFSEILTEAQLRERYEEALSQVWEFTYALCDAIQSAIRSPEADKAGLIRASLLQFQAAVDAAIPTWLAGDAVDKVGRKISAPRLEKLKSTLKMLADIIAEQEAATKEDTMPTPKIDLAKLDPAVRAHIETLETQHADLVKQVAALEGKVLETALAKGDLDEITKGMTPAQAAIFKSQQEQLKKAEETATKANSALVAKQFEEKVAVFKYLTVDIAKDAPALREIHEKCSPATATRVDELLKAADEQLKAAAILQKQLGSPASVSGSATEQLTALAKEFVAKGEAKTNAKAMELAMERYPDLYRQSQAEAMRPVSQA